MHELQENTSLTLPSSLSTFQSLISPPKKYEASLVMVGTDIHSSLSELGQGTSYATPRPPMFATGGVGGQASALDHKGWFVLVTIFSGHRVAIVVVG